VKLKGTDFEAVRRPIAALKAFVVVFVILALTRFHRTLD
jgi:hypothetical protein